jgi:hypothetical protein
MTQSKNPVDVFGRFDECLVLKHRGDNGVRDGAPRVEQLLGEQGSVVGDSEEGEHGLVGVYRSDEEGGKVIRCRLAVKIRAVDNFIRSEEIEGVEVLACRQTL